MKKIILALSFLLVSVAIFAQNLPTGAIWGNTKLKGVTSANDTSGMISLDQIKAFTNTGLGSGTVSNVSVANANGFSGNVTTSTTTPVITLTTTVTTGAIIKSSSSQLVAATSGTDYSGGTSALASGYVKSTTTTGALSTVATIPNADLTNSTITGSLTATGTDLSVSSSTALGGTLTINVPDASATARGVITVNSQTLSGAKSFASPLTAHSGFTMSGNVVESLTAVSGATALTTSSNKHQVVDATAAAITITLPTTPTSGTTFILTKKNTTANYVTVTRGGTDTIMGNVSHVIVSGLAPTKFIYNAGMWYIEN